MLNDIGVGEVQSTVSLSREKKTKPQAQRLDLKITTNEHGDRVAQRIIQAPDTDGLPVFYYVEEILRSRVEAGGVFNLGKRLTLNPAQINRLIDASSRGLPPAVAVATLNWLEEPLEVYGNSGPEEVSILASITGEAGGNKSTFAAILAFKLGIPVMDMDGMGGLGVDDYLVEFRDRGFDTTTPTAQLVTAIRQLRQKVVSPDRPQAKPLRTALHEIANLFIAGRRPPVILCDMPGRSRKIEKSRPLDIYDHWGSEGTNINMVHPKHFTGGKEGELDYLVKLFQANLVQLRVPVAGFNAEFIDNISRFQSKVR